MTVEPGPVALFFFALVTFTTGLIVGVWMGRSDRKRDL